MDQPTLTEVDQDVSISSSNENLSAQILETRDDRVSADRKSLGWSIVFQNFADDYPKQKQQL